MISRFLLLFLLAFAGVASAQDAAADKQVDESIAAMVRQGLAAAGKGDSATALFAFSSAMRLKPDDKHLAAIYFYRGNVYQDTRDYDKAVADYNEAVRLDPTFKQAYNGRGCAYDEQRVRDKALADFDEAIRLDPAYGLAYLNRGVAKNRNGMYEKAIEDYNTAVRLKPDFAGCYLNRGISLANERDYAAAIKDFSEAIRLAPSDGNAYLRRGEAYHKTGDDARALTDLAVVANGKNVLACNDFAWLLATCPQAELRDGRKAVEYARKGCELSQWKNAGLIDTLAVAYAEAGDFASAVKYEQQYLDTPGIAKQSAADAAKRLALFQAGKAYHEEPLP